LTGKDEPRLTLRLRRAPADRSAELPALELEAAGVAGRRQDARPHELAFADAAQHIGPMMARRLSEYSRAMNHAPALGILGPEPQRLDSRTS